MATEKQKVYLEILASGISVALVTGDTSYGDIALNSPVSHVFTITNTGTSTLIVYSITVPDAYTLLSPVIFPLFIPVGASTTFTVQLDATFDANGYDGDILIVNNSPVPNYLVSLTAELWAFYSGFSQAIAAPLTFPTVGTRTLNEVDGTFGFGNDVLSYPTQATPTWGDLSVRSQALSLTASMANVLVGTINQSNRNGSLTGWYPSTAIDNTPRISAYTTSSNLLTFMGGLGQIANIKTFSASTDYRVAPVWRANDYQQFVKFSEGWVRLWKRNQVDALMYAGFSNSDAVGILKEMRVRQIAESNFDPQVNLTGSQSAGQTWTAPDGDFVLQFTVTTLPSSGNIIFYFRQKDSSNKWEFHIELGGASTRLYERVEGVSNSRASGGATINGSIITLIADGANIRAFVGTTQAFSYTTAYNFLRETASELNSLGTGGVVSDIQVFKRYLRSTNGLGGELVINGDFATDTVWTKGTGWTISGGTANKVAGTSSNLAQNSILTLGKYYQMLITVSNYSAGTLSIFIGGSLSVVSITANGTYTLYGTADTSINLLIQGSTTFAGSIDNVSVKEVLFTPDSLATTLDSAITDPYDSSYIYFDDFTSTINADTIGTLTFNEQDNRFSVSGSKLNYAAQTTPTWGDLSIRSQLITMQDDVAMALAGVINQSTRNPFTVGWFSTTNIGLNSTLSIYTNSSFIRSAIGAVGVNSIDYFTNTDYPISVIARDTDSDANVEEYQSFAKILGYWVRLWDLKGQNDASMYAGASNESAVGSLDNFKVKPLASSLFDPQVSLVGSQPAGTTWAAPDGDFILKFTVTAVPSVNHISIFFKKKDANNLWELRIINSGVVQLYESVAGVFTNRSNGGAVVNGSVVTIIADGANIRAFVGTTQAWSYTNAYNFLRETAAELNSLGTGGVVSDVQVFKRYLRSTNGLGSELVANGGFAVDANWGKGAGWGISGGTANKVAGSPANLFQSGILVVGKYYEFVVTVSNYSAGVVTPTLGAIVNLASITANGTYTYRSVCAGDTSIYFQANAAFAGSIDNVSVKEILFTPDSLSDILDGAVYG